MISNACLTCMVTLVARDEGTRLCMCSQELIILRALYFLFYYHFMMNKDVYCHFYFRKGTERLFKVATVTYAKR